jgi:hypothetical protein
MACTIAVARCGLQRSFARIFQVLRVALAVGLLPTGAVAGRAPRYDEGLTISPGVLLEVRPTLRKVGLRSGSVVNRRRERPFR